jgi:predicted nucleic acid-binding Zn ribbon protein
MEQPRKSKANSARWDMDKVRFHLSKPQAPNRDIRSIDGILKDVIDGLEQPQSENILILRDAWPKLVGAQIAKHSSPGFIKDFTLYVYVDHPGWMPELERIKRFLLQKLQAQYRELRIRKLNFLLEHK